MASFLSLPNETLLLILQSCDTLSQLSSFTLTCKQLHSVYSNSIHSIWCQIGRRNIPSFEDAVITSRATRIALEHFDKGEFPPAPFPLDQLPISARKICLEDIQSLMDWNHFVTCLESICLEDTDWGPNLASSIKPADESAQPSGEWITWRDRFHRSMYRSFLMGPVLCRTYQEPLVQGTNRPENFLEKWTERALEIHQDEADYLRSFPVFNLEAYEMHEPIYGRLAEFFVRQTQPDVHDELSAKTMYFINATPDASLDRAHASAVYNAMIQCLLSTMTMWEEYLFFPDEESEDPGRTRTIRLIGTDTFYPEEISMPGHADDAKDTHMFRRMLLTGDKKNGAGWTRNAERLFGVMDLMRGLPGDSNDAIDGKKTPCPPLQIFQFIARRYLGVRFINDAFAMEVGDTSELFISHLNTGDIYLGIWPEGGPSGDLPPMFEVVP
ncbi:hypothetical protein FE257_011394 [Aspergillus nanangensis]|uniref:F-box domain-containing protein n=1 Tax=Aspergillus nanangensis TaxID=2582783 RepID=A0AAD4CJ07_ASPNN|nr:hypothetical protein FE257_011394 [Aspergillus nanangensis]